MSNSGKRRVVGFSLAATSLLGGGLATAAPASAGVEGCTAYNIYNNVDAYTIQVSYRGICNTKKVALSVQGYTMRSGYEGTLCSRSSGAFGNTNYAATGFCNVWDPAGSQKIQHLAFVDANATAADDITANTYYT